MDFEIWSRTQEYQNTSEIQPIQLSHLYDHWVRAKNSAEVPKQRDFFIDAVKEFAGHLALVDLEANPKYARYVLVGKNLNVYLAKIRQIWRSKMFIHLIHQKIYTMHSAKQCMSERPHSINAVTWFLGNSLGITVSFYQ